jgi:hypothetical protein
MRNSECGDFPLHSSVPNERKGQDHAVDLFDKVGSTDSDGVPIKWELAPVLNLMVYGEVPWRLEAL